MEIEIDLDIEEWMIANNFDCDKLSAQEQDAALIYAEQMAQNIIDEHLDLIGDQIALRFLIEGKHP